MDSSFCLFLFIYVIYIRMISDESRGSIKMDVENSASRHRKKWHFEVLL